MIVFISLAFLGFTFLLISAIFGGDHDAGDHDIGDDVDGEFDHGDDIVVHAGPSPFSVRVIAVFLTTFGAAGAIARHCDMSLPWSTAIGTAAGAVAGWIALMLLRFSYAQQATSSVNGSEMVGMIAEVKTAIPAVGVGQVSVVVKSQRFYQIARCKGGIQIEEGTPVKIVEYLGDCVIVERVQS